MPSPSLEKSIGRHGSTSRRSGLSMILSFWCTEWEATGVSTAGSNWRVHGDSMHVWFICSLTLFRMILILGDTAFIPRCC